MSSETPSTSVSSPKTKGSSFLWTLRYTLINATYFSAFCTVHACAAVFLLGNGFSNTEVGVLLAVANIISAIVQPVIAGIIDKQGALTNRRLNDLIRIGPSLVFRKQQSGDLPCLCPDLYDPVRLPACHDRALF